MSRLLYDEFQIDEVTDLGYLYEEEVLKFDLTRLRGKKINWHLTIQEEWPDRIEMIAEFYRLSEGSWT